VAHYYKVKEKPLTYEVRWSWYDGQGKRHFAKQRVRDKEQAKAKAREVEQQAADGNDPNPRPGKETLGAWAERWYNSRDGLKKPSTLRKNRSILNLTVLPAFGQRKLRSITTGDVEDFIHDLRKRGSAPPTIRHHYLVLRQVLAYAARKKAIAVNPAIDAELPTDKSVGRVKPEPHFLTEEQVALLADHLDAEQPYGLLVRFIAYTGLRVSEVSGLNIADVDPLRSMITVRRTRTKVRGGWEVHTPKSGKTRTVPLPRWLRDDLNDYIAIHPNRSTPDAPLWPGRQINDADRFKGSKGGIDWDRPWSRDAFYKRHFKPALAATGLPVATRLHDLRHTYASICASKGIPAYRVAEYLGHANETVTRMIYTHLFHEDTTADMDKLGRPFATVVTLAPPPEDRGQIG
jgi:integrase